MKYIFGWCIHKPRPIGGTFNKELTEGEKEIFNKANEIVRKYVKSNPYVSHSKGFPYIMISKTLLWLDDLRSPFEKDWIEWLSKNSPIEQPYEVIWVKSYHEFVQWIKQNGLPTAVSWDHDLGTDLAIEKVSKGMSKRQARREKRGTKSGMDACKWLVEYCLDKNLKMPPYSIQSANPAGKENIDGLLKGFIKHQKLNLNGNN